MREAAVIGIPDPLQGEAVRAYVVADTSANLTPQSIRNGCAKFLESHMVPTQVVICENLPRNANGKINRRFLREETLPNQSPA